MAKRLITADDVRRYQAWICVQVEKDLMEAAKANILSLIAGRALKAIEVGNNDLVDKLIERIEERMDK